MSTGITGVFKFAQRWLKANQVMLSNTASLVGTTAVTSGLGFAFWGVAAHLYPGTSGTAAIGVANAAVSTMMLLGGIGMVGLGTLLVTELPRRPEQAGPLISISLIVSGLAGGLVGALFALFAPLISPQFEPLRETPLDVVLFAVGVGLTAATSVLDLALIGILQGGLQFWRNALFSLIKLVLLFVVGLFLLHKTGMTIYLTWTAAMGISMLVLFFYMLYKNGWRGKDYIPHWGMFRELGVEALKHHGLNMILQVPTQLLPVLVAAQINAGANAVFYFSWMIANFVFLIPNSLTMVLHAMNSANQSALRQRARITVGLAFVITLSATVVFYIGTNLILGLFGPIYVEYGTWCLRILVLASFPAIIKNHYISFCRIRDRITVATINMFLGGVLELVGTIVGAHFGAIIGTNMGPQRLGALLGIHFGVVANTLTPGQEAGLLGLCLGWLIAVMLEGIWMSPLVAQVLFPTKGAAEIILPVRDDLDEISPIWAVETMFMPTVSLRKTTGHLSVRLPTTSLRESEPMWLIDTLTLPAIKQASRPLPAIRKSRKSRTGDEPIEATELLSVPAKEEPALVPWGSKLDWSDAVPSRSEAEDDPELATPLLQMSEPDFMEKAIVLLEDKSAPATPVQPEDEPDFAETMILTDGAPVQPENEPDFVETMILTDGVPVRPEDEPDSAEKTMILPNSGAVLETPLPQEDEQDWGDEALLSAEEVLELIPTMPLINESEHNGYARPALTAKGEPVLTALVPQEGEQNWSDEKTVIRPKIIPRRHEQK